MHMSGKLASTGLGRGCGERPSWSVWLPDSPCSTSQRCLRPCTRRALRPVAAVQPQLLDKAAESAAEAAQQSDRLERSRRPRASTSKDAEADSGILYPSTWQHRAWTWSSITLLAATILSGSLKIHDTQTLIGALVAALVGYYVADFATGVYHWGVDNYGDGNTPVLGEQIAAFQGHHREPWTITQRQFCNNVHKVFKPAVPFSAACLLASPWLPAWLDVGLPIATILTCMSQQFHAWAHMKGSQLPGSVQALQDAGLLVSRRAHGAHHMAPFEGNYCIVSGAWNSVLDGSGFFRKLERVVHERTGVQPRCWEPADSPLFKR